MKSFAGGCHCGALKVIFTTGRAAIDVWPRACDCSFCRRHGAAYLSDRDGQLEIVDSGNNVYQFGFRITDFHICQQCGVLVAATWRDSDGAIFGVANMRALEITDFFKNAPAQINFDLEKQSDREHRRRAHWTPSTLTKPDLNRQEQ